MPSLTLALVLSILLLTLAAPVAAQQGPDLGQLFLSFDPDLVDQDLDLEPNQTFDVYLRAQVDFGDLGEPARNDFDGIKTWETCVTMPPEITVLDRIVMHPSFNGADDSCGENWQMVLDSCLRAENTPATLVRYRCRLDLDVTNLEISLEAASPSSIEGERPGWFQCVFTGQPSDLHAFASGYTEPVVINGGVATDGASWSSLKGRF
jgi:hypothetical protein